MAECPDCARKLAALEQAWKCAREAGRAEAPPFLQGRIAARIREYERNRRLLSDLGEALRRVAQRSVVVMLVAGAVGLGIFLGGSASNASGKAAQGAASYLDSFADLPPQSVGSAYATLTGTSK